MEVFYEGLSFLVRSAEITSWTSCWFPDARRVWRRSIKVGINEWCTTIICNVFLRKMIKAERRRERGDVFGTCEGKFAMSKWPWSP